MVEKYETGKALKECIAFLVYELRQQKGLYNILEGEWSRLLGDFAKANCDAQESARNLDKIKEIIKDCDKSDVIFKQIFEVLEDEKVNCTKKSYNSDYKERNV